MKVRLVHASRDVDPETPLPGHAEALEQDLELGTLLDVMGGDDPYVRERSERTLLASSADPEEIVYRQGVLRDCLAHPDVARELYTLAVEALESRRNAGHFWFRDNPEALVHKSVAVLELLAGSLRRLRDLAAEQRPRFESDGFAQLFETLERELGGDYLATVAETLQELAFRRGVLVSAGLGRGNRSTGYVLRQPHELRLRDRLATGRTGGHSFTLPARDDHGLETLATLKDRGLVRTGDALAQATDHVLGFFATLRAELAFYVGCLNLHERLTALGGGTCFPVPVADTAEALSGRGLYDPALAFHLDAQAVGNDLDADGRRLVIVTGANQGGKSTFLRSVGVAQLMMQAGMFVAADAFRSSVVAGVFTHFKREEDATMTHGKLDEELDRMSEIADRLRPGCLLLCNESFASTNEREGSEIARHVIRAATDAGVRVVFVTHLYDLAHGFYAERSGSTLFLRAERRPDGTRTYRLPAGEPLPTSFGADAYRRVFGDGACADSHVERAGEQEQ